MSPQQKPVDADSAASARAHLQSVNIRCLGCPQVHIRCIRKGDHCPDDLASSHKAGWGRNAAQHVGRSSQGNQLMFRSAAEAHGLSVGMNLWVSTTSPYCQQMLWRWER